MSHAPDNPLIYACPFCNTPVEVAPEWVGETIHCPNGQCGQAFQVAPPVAHPAAAPDAAGPGSQHEMAEGQSDDERELQVVHPVMFRNHPLQFLFCAALILGGLFVAAAPQLVEETISVVWLSRGLGLIPAFVGAVWLLVWWISTRCTTLTVTSKRTILRYGIIARSTSEVQHDDVRNLQVHQSIWECLVRIGRLALSSSGQDELEIQVRGIPDPAGLASLIRGLQ